jgi:hypothetical protein
MTDAESTPRKPSLLEKRAITDAVAQAIIDQEVLEREKKTERLRALRLAQEATTPVKAPRRKRK